MFSQRPWIAAALAGSALLAPLVHAQGTGGTGGSTGSSTARIAVYLISIGGVEAEPGQNWLGVEQCRDKAIVEFKLDGAPAGVASIDIYTGENCNSTDRTNDTNNRCTYLDTQNGGITQGLMVKVKASDLIEDCETAEQAKPKLWFLAVNDPMGTENVGGNYGMFDKLWTDTRPPAAPHKLTGGEGENQIPISWISGEIELKGFRIYIDPNAGAPGSSGGASGSSASENDDAGAQPTDGGSAIGVPNPNCPSSALIPGASVADLPAGIAHKTLDEPTATGTDLSPNEVTGMHAAIAVVAVDLAGNESPLSNVECVDIVPTAGFWDRYQENGGDAKTGCPCSAVGAAQIESAWPVGLAVLALGLSARRRRSS